MYIFLFDEDLLKSNLFWNAKLGWILSLLALLYIFQKSQTVQMQRIISRCKCQFFFVSYGDTDLGLLKEVPPPVSIMFVFIVIAECIIIYN